MSVTNSAAKKGPTTRAMSSSLEAMEAVAQSTYKPPGSYSSPKIPSRQVEWVRNTDGTPLIDHKGCPISVNRMLATKPLRGELSSRPGPGNRKLTYLSGEGVTRTLNDIFGFDGWNLDIKETKREECVKDDKDRFHVAYTATVRLTHRNSGAYKEDCGAGDALDRSMGTAVAHALKGAITDAMKRAARHFGDKLGNSLYDSSFSINKAPNSLQEALDQYDIARATTKFGLPQNAQNSVTPASSNLAKVESIDIHVTTSNVPHSAIKACSSSIQSTTHHATATKPLPPVPSFSATITPANAKAVINPIVTPAADPVPKQGPPVRGSAVPQPTPRQSQPPPTPTQGLQSSALFHQQLSTFAAGTNNTMLPDTKVCADQQQFPANENIPPIDFDAYDRVRPRTSSGPKPSTSSFGPLAGKRKLHSESADNHSRQARKQPSLNPYAPC